jgi:hypothetical protein
MEGSTYGLLTVPREVVYQIADCYRVWVLLRHTCKGFGYLGDYHAFHGIGFTAESVACVVASYAQFISTAITTINTTGYNRNVMRMGMQYTESDADILQIFCHRRSYSLELTFYGRFAEVLFTIICAADIDWSADCVRPLYICGERYEFIPHAYNDIHAYRYIYLNFPELFRKMRIFARISYKDILNY